MFGIGSTELLVILLVALIVLGPKSLAGVSRSLGRAMGEFRKVSNDFQRTLNVEAAQEEAREKMKKRASSASQTAQESPLNPYSEANANNIQTKEDRTAANATNIQVKEDRTAENPEKPTEKTSPLEAAVARAHAEAAQADKNNG